MVATPEGWLAGRTLGDLRLRDEGVVVLGIARSDGSYIGVPDGETEVRSGDTLIAYGRVKSFEDLTRRPPGREGDEAHDRAVRRQHEVDRQERTGGDATGTSRSRGGMA